MPNVSTIYLSQFGLPNLGDPKSADYNRKKHLFFNNFYHRSAAARRGVDSKYEKRSKLPKLPIDCFKDELRSTLGETDMSELQDPLPAEAPEDPIEFAENAIKECKYEI